MKIHIFISNMRKSPALLLSKLLIKLITIFDLKKMLDSKF